MLTLDQIKAARDDASNGPWEVDKRAFPKIGVICGEEGICQDIFVGNAPLIAMAPDLAQLALDQAAEIERLIGDDITIDRHIDVQSRVLHDMGDPNPAVSKQWLREYFYAMQQALKGSDK